MPNLGFGSSVLQRWLYRSVLILQAKYKERGTVLAEDQLAQVGDPALLCGITMFVSPAVNPGFISHCFRVGALNDGTTGLLSPPRTMLFAADVALLPSSPS